MKDFGIVMQENFLACTRGEAFCITTLGALNRIYCVSGLNEHKIEPIRRLIQQLLKLLLHKTFHSSKLKKFPGLH
jgi:hypothetical protein